MRFEAMPRVYKDQPLWGARSGQFTFMISQDEPDGYTASVKILGATPFDGTRYDLGGYCAHKSFTAAEQACRKFMREKH